jgi:hypothetical protein
MPAQSFDLAGSADVSSLFSVQADLYLLEISSERAWVVEVTLRRDGAAFDNRKALPSKSGFDCGTQTRTVTHQYVSFGLSLRTLSTMATNKLGLI